jgi:F0F1-type ATP synthase membrane subunit c/vacuolar-type H+-ATPase subunit K
MVLPGRQRPAGLPSGSALRRRNWPPEALAKMLVGGSVGITGMGGKSLADGAMLCLGCLAPAVTQGRLSRVAIQMVLRRTPLIHLRCALWLSPFVLLSSLRPRQARPRRGVDSVLLRALFWTLEGFDDCWRLERSRSPFAQPFPLRFQALRCGGGLPDLGVWTFAPDLVSHG